MLWAQFQPKNDAEAGIVLVGAAIAGLISGGIPFFTGLAMRQKTLAITGGLVSGTAGFLAGCCGGIPVALIFTGVIIAMAQSSPPPIQSPWDKSLHEDYDDYVRAVRLPGRDPARDRDRGSIPYAEEVRGDESDRGRQAGGGRGRQPDRRREAEDDWRRRSEDEEKYRQRGFRPRRPDPGSDF
jgi:hypothetical protein